MLPKELIETAEKLSEALRARAQTLTTVESCTGGLVGAAITALPGSSDIYPGGFITYSNTLKQQLVGVSPDTLSTHGAVSAQTAIEMARGGLRQVASDYAISISGIAGPDGGTAQKPVGTVWICSAGQEARIDCRRFVFPGDRAKIRRDSAITAMSILCQMVQGHDTPLMHEQERADA